MIRIQNPGTWNEYIRNNQHLKLHINELKSRYTKQLALFENQQQLYEIQRNLMNESMGGGSVFDNTINEFVENDYIEDYFL